MATVPLGLYLWRRIREIGVETVMGVPGDFNLANLDFIYQVPGMQFVGNSNELNAAYAADGYARAHSTPGCLITTHGVGELSALNGIAGSMAEHIPVIHIVGQTPLAAQNAHKMIHHSMGFAPDHQVYNKAASGMRCAVAELFDATTAPAEIDRVIRECVIQSRPVYILLPSDLIFEDVPESRLDNKIDLSPPIDASAESDAVEATLKALETALNPSILVDHLAQRHGRVEAKRFVDKLQWPTFASHMGKALVDEDRPYYVGSYNGKISFPGVAEAVEDSDLVLALGWFPADTNTGGFTQTLKKENMILVQDDHVVVKGREFRGVYLASFLNKLTEAVHSSLIAKFKIPNLPHRLPFSTETTSNAIRQEEMWYQVGKFIRPGDIVIGETGTASFGLQDVAFPKDTEYYAQTYYGSIGFATPAAMGSALAVRDMVRSGQRSKGRVVLFTGDGSLQLTVQEIGTMVRLGLELIIVILNNNGYTIERAIHGAQAGYNDINPTNYSHLLPLFFHPSPESAYRSARTTEQLEAAFKEGNLSEPKHLQILELHIDALDIPWRLAGVLSAMGLGSHIEKEKFIYPTKALQAIKHAFPTGHVNGSPKNKPVPDTEKAAEHQTSLPQPSDAAKGMMPGIPA